MSVVERAPVPAPSWRARLVTWADKRLLWLFTLPALVFVLGMIAFPIVWMLWLSMTGARGSIRSAYQWVGAANYIDVLTDTARFWPAVGRTVAFTVGALAIELVLGMCIALLLRRPFKAQGWVRVMVLLPFVATPVAVAMVWRLLLDPNLGLANVMLGWVGIPPQPWLAEAATTLPTLIMIDVWQFTPMVAIILLAGLTALPEEPDESARIDGANTWQRFWYVTLPMLSPVVAVAVLLRSIDAFKSFDVLWATKGPGGGAEHEAETLNIYAYTLSFKFNEFGNASTVLVLFLFATLSIAWLISRRGLQRS